MSAGKVVFLQNNKNVLRYVHKTIKDKGFQVYPKP